MGSADCFMTERTFSETAGRSIQLFNGVDHDGWGQAGPGGFRIENGMLVTEGGMGLLWYAARQFENLELKVD
jgi:Xaa-Pro aminopeptidase